MLPEEGEILMNKTLMPDKEFYTEPEAAAYLNISIPRLHSLLDEHIFNDGSARPGDLTFCESDMVLLKFWRNSQPNPKVIRMPRRN